MTSGQRVHAIETGKELLKVGRSIANTGHRTILLWLLALSVLFVERVYVLPSDIATLEAYQAEKRRGPLDRTRRLEWFRRLTPEAEPTERRQFPQLRATAKTDQEALEQRFRQFLEDTKSNPIDLPLGIKLKTVPGYLHAMLFLGLLLVVLYYALQVRRRAYHAIARGLRLLREASLPDRATNDNLVPDLPWWMGPPPSVDSLVSAENLRTATCWHEGNPRWNALRVMTAGGLTLSFGYGLYAAWRSTALLALTIRGELGTITTAEWTVFLYQCFVIILGALGLLWVFLLVEPVRVPDHHPGERFEPLLPRRRWLQTASASVVGLAAVGGKNLLASSIGVKQTARQPRFRSALKGKKPPSRSERVEREAIELERVGKPDDAYKLLLTEVRMHPGNLRLWDLMAVWATRSDTGALRLAALVDLARASSDRVPSPRRQTKVQIKGPQALIEHPERVAPGLIERIITGRKPLPTLPTLTKTRCPRPPHDEAKAIHCSSAIRSTPSGYPLADRATKWAKSKIWQQCWSKGGSREKQGWRMPNMLCQRGTRQPCCVAEPRAVSKV
jgi:hypothetical protein